MHWTWKASSLWIIGDFFQSHVSLSNALPTRAIPALIAAGCHDPSSVQATLALPAPQNQALPALAYGQPCCISQKMILAIDTHH